MSLGDYMAIKKKKKEVKAKYTLGEEIVNSISHGVGAGLAIAGLVLICCLAHSAIGVVSGVIYASLMIILFTISCVYHSLCPRFTDKKVLRNFLYNFADILVCQTNDAKAYFPKNIQKNTLQ